MAKEAKKDPQELTVEQKLKALFQLQTMLSKIDEIKTLRGELPLYFQWKFTSQRLDFIDFGQHCLQLEQSFQLLFYG